jgi:hypothetical protein
MAVHMHDKRWVSQRLILRNISSESNPDTGMISEASFSLFGKSEKGTNFILDGAAS